MRYITIAPDYTGSCIQDEFEGKINLQAFELPQQLEEKILEWHKKYRQIIPLSIEERKEHFIEISSLDQEGLEIAELLKNHLHNDSKIRYFSEGQQKYLNNLY